LNRHTTTRAALLGIVTAFLVAACSDHRLELRLIEPRLDVDRNIARSFAELMEDKSSVSVSIVASSGSEETSIDALLSDRADIALVSNIQPYTSGITTVMPLYANILHILQRQPPTAKTEAELFTSGRIFAGPPGSPSRLMLERYAAERQINSADMHFVESFAGKCPDIIAIFAPIMRDLRSRLASCGEPGLYRLYSLGTPDDIGSGAAIDAATLLNPSLRAFVIPAGTYIGVSDEPVLTLAVDKMLVARRDLPDTVVYDLFREVIRLQPALAADNPTLFHAIRDDFSASESTFVLHPGAQNYLARNEPTIYERYSGVAEVVVTVFIALLSASYAALRIYKIRRKNRIDLFYSAAIAVRKSIADTAHVSDRENAIARVRALQTEAFELLIDEKLAGDENFHIFLTLSNNIIEELKEASAPDRAPDT
jgi:TRAP-type uncharacterized transport system substrate-binding protein